MITKLRDSWFEEEGYWKTTLDMGSRGGNYISHQTSLYTEMANELFGTTKQGNKTIIYKDSKMYTTRIILPQQVLDYLNDKHK